jgi:predicted Zn-dependent protease with MMP-like domain
MRLADFEAMVRRLAAEIPEEFLAGVLEVTVSPRTLPHPTRGEIWTLGECIPVAGEGGEVQSRVVLYHGSFAAVAYVNPDFDWGHEARETLQHELRHHLEWRANQDELEELDRAAEANFARQDGESFDPLFFLHGDSPVPGVYQVDDDWFLDHVVRAAPSEVSFTWHGQAYQAAVPSGATLPAFLTVSDLQHPPPGDVILVLRRKPRVLDLFRSAPVPWQGEVAAGRLAAGD